VSLTPYILGGIAIFVVARLFAASGEAPPAPTPPPLPPTPLRRLRKRSPKAPAPVEEETPRVPAVRPAVSRVPVITQPLMRYGHHAIRQEFASRAALRRAIIAQEVLGPPLSERPPRL
jgi:hypothetical protein